MSSCFLERCQLSRPVEQTSCLFVFFVGVGVVAGDRFFVGVGVVAGGPRKIVLNCEK